MNQGIINKQKELQYELAKKFKGRPNQIIGLSNVGDIVDALELNRGYINEEITELIDSLGKDNNAVRKPWKLKYTDLRSMDYPLGFNEDEVHRVKDEAIDILHFVTNIFIILGIDEDEILTLYMNKNKENFDRQKLGY